MRKQYVMSDNEPLFTPETKKQNNCSIYVPYDCKNNCSFCVSKEIYDKYPLDLDRYLETIDEIANSDIDDISITGGEPAQNITILELILMRLQKEGRSIYINTTLPYHSFERFKALCSKYNVTGVSVSRHAICFEDESLLGITPDEEILTLPTKLRINCVCSGERAPKFLDAFCKRWEDLGINTADGNFIINFRENYSNETPETLHLLKTTLIANLCEVANYYGRLYCHVCDKVIFKRESGLEIRSSKVLPSTRVEFGNVVEVQSLVAFPNGHLATDWDGSTIGLNEIKAVLNFRKK